MLCGSLDGRGDLGENGYMYMYGWVPLQFTWNCHNVGYTPIQNEKFKRIKIEEACFLRVPRPDFFLVEINSHTFEGCRGWAPGGQDGRCWRGAEDSSMPPAAVIPACQAVGGSPCLSCTCPDSLSMMPGPSVSHASCHRFQTSQETASFHFQLCQMGLLCNQTWLSPRIDPKAPSDLMTFPRALLSLTSCLGWWAALPHPHASWGLELHRESPRLNCCCSSLGTWRQSPLAAPVIFLYHRCSSLASGSREEVHGPLHFEKVKPNSDNGVCPIGQGQGFKVGECWTPHLEGTRNKLSLTPYLARSAKDTWKNP